MCKVAKSPSAPCSLLPAPCSLFQQLILLLSDYLDERDGDDILGGGGNDVILSINS
ncbi:MULTISPECIES: hypothetical protein [unclassified Moorena]|uniref:hypothetical protein n=1 Tax=unclassified Moorena TaxID=2683338 RepID=UPI0013CD38A1|nr:MULTISPECIES: hypothetical protein [unclassified Moorena]NEP30791.1 hypothetical protein [Moorena sp. SIO3B2]NES43256.1 hypothetical protein [Moorena sp. SIO2C4]